MFVRWCLVFGFLVTTLPKLTAEILYTVTDLGILEGQSFSRAVAINDSGQIVGYSGPYGFLYSNGNMTNLGTPPGARFPLVTPTAISNSGLITGLAVFPSNSASFLLYNNGEWTDLGLAPGSSSTTACSQPEQWR